MNMLLNDLRHALRRLRRNPGFTDPATFAAIASLLISVALLACYIPAR